MTTNGPVTPGDHFFLYGLLRQGAEGMPAHINLEAGGAFQKSVALKGDLYDLGGFPGIVDGKGLVQGILYRLNDVSLVPLLDEFEDVKQGDEPASLYLRVRKPVLDVDGRSTGETAWVYWYNKPVTGRRRIKTGDWLHEQAARQKAGKQ